ncbi:MAG: FKBP-type peptidyl-prolyl cis-trans isomerase [Planctomycetota bacterium]|nr:FKBP-type peptidyl-prolyl cis-trans isomerase [Planctomycetota bacterium]
MLILAASLLTTPLLAPELPAPATTVAATTAAAATSPEDPPIPDCGAMTMLPSGLRYCVIKEGDGSASPSMGDLVRVNYTGWNLDGTVFDGSRTPRRPGLDPQPAEFPIGGLIDGWNEALQLMSPGAQWKLYVPAAMAYGPKGSPPKIAPNADLIFEVELLAVIDRALPYTPFNPEAEGVIEKPSGVKLQVLSGGKGASCADADIGLVKFSCFTPEGAFVVGHTSQGGPLTLSSKQVPLPFMKDALEHLKAGARVVMNVPAKIGIGQRSGNPILKPGSEEIWVLDCAETFSFAKPEFQVPDESELTTTPSGLQYKTIREGTGRSPKVSNRVLAHYAGWLMDGSGFDNSYDRGSPSEFPLANVIPGWTEGLQLMKEGGATLFVIPSELGYGARGMGGAIPPNAKLVFYVELVTVK